MTILSLFGAYLLLGLVVGVWLAFWGVNRLDPTAKSGTLGFRLLILPGLLVFWPLFVLRLFKGQKTPPVESNAHRRAANTGES